MTNTIYEDYDGRRQFTAEHYQTYNEQLDILRQHIKKHPHDFIRWAEEHPAFKHTMAERNASFETDGIPLGDSPSKSF